MERIKKINDFKNLDEGLNPIKSCTSIKITGRNNNDDEVVWFKSDEGGDMKDLLHQFWDSKDYDYDLKDEGQGGALKKAKKEIE